MSKKNSDFLTNLLQITDATEKSNSNHRQYYTIV